MTERGASALERSAGAFTVGPSSAEWDGTALTVRIRERGAPVPWPLRGTLRVIPDFLTEAAHPLSPDGSHAWAPVAPRARIEVGFDQPNLSWAGQAYLDTNWGDRPLEDSFSGWHWSRTHLKAGTAILYDSRLIGGQSESRAMLIGPDGSTADLDLPVHHRLKRSLWGIERATRTDSQAPPSVLRTLEDAPFYARSMVDASLLGERATSVHESLSLERFSRGWVKALLPWRMPRWPF